MQTPNQTQTQNITPAPVELPGAPIVEMNEAPYSWNATALDTNGWLEQFTVRAVSERGFLQRVGQLKAQLNAQGYKPASRYNHSAGARENEPAPVCAIHNKPMHQRQGKNGSFWSCAEKLGDGTYCPYKPPKS